MLTFSQASLRAKPPPSRKMTPQASLVSTSFQLMREGEFSGLLLKDWNGQNLKDVGIAKATSTICGRFKKRFLVEVPLNMKI